MSGLVRLLALTTRAGPTVPEDDIDGVPVRVVRVQLERDGKGASKDRAERRGAKVLVATDLREARELLQPYVGTGDSTVIIALDEIAASIAWHVVAESSDVVAVNGRSAVADVLAALQSGIPAAALTTYPAFSPRQLLRGGRWTSPTSGLSAKSSPGGAVAIGDEPSEGTHLLIGMANYAAQGWAWARAVSTYVPEWTASNIGLQMPGAKLHFPANLPVSKSEWQHPETRQMIVNDYVTPASHVLLEAMRPIVAVGEGPAANPADPESARNDIEALKSSGRQVAVLLHGSEARHPDIHARLNPWSPFVEAGNARQTRNLRISVEQRRELLVALDVPVFVATLDLLDFVEAAAWLPIVVGSEFFSPPPPVLVNPRPTVVHAPTSSILKGSEWVDPVLRRLDSEGLVTYRRLTGVPPAAVASVIRDADVVIDQIVLGNLGTLALQSMACGRLVVAQVPESVRRRYPTPPPVVEANPATLEEVVRAIAEAPDAYRPLALSGPHFAQRYHDGRRSARVLEDGFLAMNGRS